MLWDIFCKVIDNYGDVGVCWRLAADLAGRGETVRLHVDDPAPLAWMAPDGCPGVGVRPWNGGAQDPGDVVIEAFGCELDASFQAALAARAASAAPPSVWINLEYLSAEPFAERTHGLPSPVLSGPAAGLTKHFFYPGFTPRTGGLIREPGLAQRQATFDRDGWRREHGVTREGSCCISLFCYEPPALGTFLDRLAARPEGAHLLVTPGRAASSTRRALDAGHGRGLPITWLPHLSQQGFDELLWACDFNFVRGEDSLVRALWAGRPFAWQIYPQDDGAHEAKLEAWLDAMEAPASLRDFHAVWNGVDGGAVPELDLAPWQKFAQSARQRLWDHELTGELLRFCEKKR
jgi:uncharacterized repeat protein (TIGR03837 family)